MESIKKIFNDIKNKKWSPIYFLMGDEPYYINKITNLIKNTVLNKEEKLLNQIIIYGNDTNIDTIISHAKQYPIIGKYIVIIVMEAQYLSESIENLLIYVEKPVQSTILVICYKYKLLNKYKKLYKSIKKHGVIFESKKLYEYQIQNWIDIKIKKMGLHINENAKLLFIEYVGLDLLKLNKEINKLSVFLPKNTEITNDIIKISIGINRNYNYFELQKAIAQKNINTIYKIIYYFGNNTNKYPLIFILNLLYNFFTNLIKYHILISLSKPFLNENFNISIYSLKDYKEASQNYSLKKIIKIIPCFREIDAKVKGLETNSIKKKELLKELIFKILE